MSFNCVVNLDVEYQNITTLVLEIKGFSRFYLFIQENDGTKCSDATTEFGCLNTYQYNWSQFYPCKNWYDNFSLLLLLRL